MKTNRLPCNLNRVFTWLVSACLLASANARAVTVDSWSSFLGNSWQTSNSWSVAIPPFGGQFTVYVTNEFLTGFSKTITINAATAANFPGTMTVSNLIVLGASAIGGSPPLGQNILSLNNVGNSPFTVTAALTVGNDGVVFITNSVLNAGTETINGLSTLFLTSGTNSVGNTLTVGDGSSGAALWMNGGSLSALNATVNIGGTFAQSNGVTTIAGTLLNDGSWILAGGTQSCAPFYLADVTETATALVSGGHLNFASLNVQFGSMIISNGSASGGNLTVANINSSLGTLTVAGGTVSAGNFFVGEGGGTGTVWMTGGSLTASGDLLIGDQAGGPGLSSGALIQSNGTMTVLGEAVGNVAFVGQTSVGTLTVAGGIHIVGTDGFYVGDGVTGTVWLTGGQLIAINASTYIGSFGVGQMTISNGVWIAHDVFVGPSSSEGTLTFLGGSSTVLSNMNLGNCGADSFGFCRLSGGSLFVTNAAHNAVLNIRNCNFLMTGGHLVVDTLVMTNDCSLFIHAGGTVSVSNLILDPNLDADGDGLPNGWEIAHGLDPLDSSGVNGADGDPDGDGYSNMQEYLAGSDPQNPLSTPLNPMASFSFTSIVRNGNNVFLTWNTVGGTTNQVQVSSGNSDSSYSTNNFTNLGAQIFITGNGAVITNFTDINGATNKPARYYRIRLVP